MHSKKLTLGLGWGESGKNRTYWLWLQAIAAILPLNNVISGSSAGALVLSFTFHRGWRLLDNAANRGWLCLAGWFAIATLLGYDPGIAWIGLADFLPFMAFHAIAASLIQTPQQIDRLCWLGVLGSFPVSLMGILQAAIDRPDWTLPRLFRSYIVTLGMSPDRRVASLFGHFNEAAIYLLLLLPLTAYFIHAPTTSEAPHSSPWWQQRRLWAGVALPLNLITLFLLGSRNAWALAAIAIVWLGIYYRHWWLAGGLAAGAVLVGWGVWGPLLGLGGEWVRVILPGGFVNRLASALDASRGDYLSTLYRFDAWKFALELIGMHPIQGWGLQTFPILGGKFGYALNDLPHEHNLFLLLAVGTGIPGLLGFLGTIGWILWRAMRAPLDPATRQLVHMLAIAIVLYLMSGMLDVVFHEPRVNLLVWLILAMLAAAPRVGERFD